MSNLEAIMDIACNMADYGPNGNGALLAEMLGLGVQDSKVLAVTAVQVAEAQHADNPLAALLSAFQQGVAYGIAAERVRGVS